MEKRYTILAFLSRVFMIFGITTVLLNILCLIFGDDAFGYSTIFSLGAAGVSVKTSFQYLLALTIVMLLRMVFMTDMLIKNMSITARIVSVFIGVLVVTVVFVFTFGWFPANDPLAWFMFIVCFAISCFVSVIISTVAERQENRRLDEALKRIKENY